MLSLRNFEKSPAVWSISVDSRSRPAGEPVNRYHIELNNNLQRVRELTIQANSGALDPASRQMIGAELRQRRDEMVDLANRKDASGGYLFAGTSTATQPFARSARPWRPWLATSTMKVIRCRYIGRRGATRRRRWGHRW